MEVNNFSNSKVSDLKSFGAFSQQLFYETIFKCQIFVEKYAGDLFLGYSVLIILKIALINERETQFIRQK